MASLDTLTLPDDIQWIDEHTHSPWDMSERYTRGGKLVINQRKRGMGRRITINCHWLTYTELQALFVMLEDNVTMVLTLADATTRNVKFRHLEPPPIQTDKIIDFAVNSSTDKFLTQLKFIEV